MGSLVTQGNPGSLKYSTLFSVFNEHYSIVLHNGSHGDYSGQEQVCRTVHHTLLEMGNKPLR